MNPITDQNGLLRSSGRLLFAPTESEIKKFPIILDSKEKIARLYIENAHKICAHQATQPVKSFLQQCYYISGMRKVLLIKYRCFLFRRFNTQNIQPIMAPLPAFRFLTEEIKFPFANTGLDFFGPFYIENKQSKIEKHYGLVLPASLRDLSFWKQTCSDINADTFLNAYRQFTCRRCQPVFWYSDNGKTFVGASEELKGSVKALDKDKIYKALAAVKTTWKFNPLYGSHFGGVWERLIQSAKRTLLLILVFKLLLRHL